MRFCRSVMLGGILALAPLCYSAASEGGSKLAETAYQDWVGMLYEISLPDTSILNEYVAQTFSGSTAGASLQVAFMPRFNCNPVISLMFKELQGLPGNIEGQVIELKIDGEKIDLPTIVDEKDSMRRYSFNADEAAQQALRQMLDISNRLTVTWVQESDKAEASETAENSAVAFSLLGSQKSMHQVEINCRRHKPVPFAGQ